jgi:hypothetical protein
LNLGNSLSWPQFANLLNQGMIQVVGRHDFLLAICFLAKTTLPGFRANQPILFQTVWSLE